MEEIKEDTAQNEVENVASEEEAIAVDAMIETSLETNEKKPDKQGNSVKKKVWPKVIL